MTRSNAQHVRMQKFAGMGRFFSPKNLGRYRKLASGAIGEIEQRQLLEDLAEEMNAFRREARVASVDRRPVPIDSISSQAAGQI